MKICVYADNHFCKYSSIIRQRGNKYSLRLENQIQSLNWVEQLAAYAGCKSIVCLGDFFDKPILDAEELSALSEINFYKNISHSFLVGNHELGDKFGEFNSVNALSRVCNAHIFNKPTSFIVDDVQVCFLPYLTEYNKLDDIFKLDSQIVNKRIIFSHNDIKGIQYGGFLTTSGFDIDDIKNSCDLFINGHLHNGCRINNVVNLGNLTGQNFNEDAFKYEHCALIIDTDSLHIDFYKNPHAFNFYKVDFTEDSSIDYINEMSAKFCKNSILAINCLEKNYDYIKTRFGGYDSADMALKQNIPHNCNVVCSRVLVQRKCGEDISHPGLPELTRINHIDMFNQFIKEQIGSSEDILGVLGEICK